MGSKKQSDAAKRGSNIQMSMFDTLNKQQQPYIQGGYGAMSRINTLLGLGAASPGAQGGSAGGPPPSAPMSSAYAPTPQGGMDQRVPSPAMTNGAPDQNMRLKQLLALRARNGDTEAARMLGNV